LASTIRLLPGVEEMSAPIAPVAESKVIPGPAERKPRTSAQFMTAFTTYGFAVEPAPVTLVLVPACTTQLQPPPPH
jgi:hypothetical protein